jgi:hypothetical protein
MALVVVAEPHQVLVVLLEAQVPVQVVPQVQVLLRQTIPVQVVVVVALQVQEVQAVQA